MREQPTCSPDELSELAEAIDEAVRAKLAKGWTIVQHVTWSGAEKCCCPVGALNNRADARIRINGEWVRGFSRGFDGEPLQSGEHTQIYDLGASTRERYALEGVIVERPEVP